MPSSYDHWKLRSPFVDSTKLSDPFDDEDIDDDSDELEYLIDGENGLAEKADRANDNEP